MRAIHLKRMNAHHPPSDAPIYTPPSLARARKALNLTLGFVLLLAAAFWAQAHTDWRGWAVVPGSWQGLWGILGAPVLHGSLQHLVANASSLLILGTLAGTVYPRATALSLPLLWVGSGVGAWLWGDPGSYHLGASGLTHGLMFLVLTLAIIKRDRAAIAAALIAFLFYGGMLLSVLPNEPGVSWQSHMGGAMAGVLAGLVLRKADPQAPPARYSWDDEEEHEEYLQANNLLDGERPQSREAMAWPASAGPGTPDPSNRSLGRPPEEQRNAQG